MDFARYNLAFHISKRNWLALQNAIQFKIYALVYMDLYPFLYFTICKNEKNNYNQR